VVAQPLRRAEELVALWLCVAPLRLGGLRGKKSTPSVGWEVPVSSLAVGKQEQERREPQGARGTSSRIGEQAQVSFLS
jgi:hypothetical protein